MLSKPVGAFSLNFLIGYSTSLSVFGSNLPMNISPKSVYQTLPSLSTSTSCGSLVGRTTSYWVTMARVSRPKGRDTRAIVTQYDVVRPTSEPHDVLVDKEGKVWYTDFGEMFIGKFDPKTLKLVEYPIKKFKDKAPTGLLSIEFDHEGKIWFDTMYQGALGCLDPKTGKIAYYPVPPEWNDDTVQLNFTGLRHDVDGKVWTKSVGTQHIFRLDVATSTWERF